MKKSLLILSAAMLASGAATAASSPKTVTFSASSLKAPSVATSHNVRANAAGETPYLVYSKAGEPVSAYTLNNLPSRCTVYLATEMSVADQQPYIGADITAVNVMAGSSANNGNFPISRVLAFVTDDLGKVPTDRTVGTIDTTPFSVTSIQLDNPVTITGEKPLYFGYFMSVSTQCYFMPTDCVPTDPTVRNLMVGVANKVSDVPSYTNYSDQEPGSLCISINISGDNLPENVGTMTGIDLPFYMSDAISYDINIKNLGVNNLTSASVKTEISNGKVYESKVDFDQPIVPGSTQTVTISGIPNEEEGIFELTSTLVQVNGVDIANPVSLTSAYGSYANGYDRRPVIEEGTGTWCGFCPRGIVMMEYLKKNYPDWIRIAVHVSDRMSVNSYSGWVNQFSGGNAPVAVTNRVIETPVAGAYDEYYKPIYDAVTEYPAYAKVTLAKAICSEDGKKVSISSTTEVACDVNVPHMLSFVIVEDHVGPYGQSNYYAGGGYGPLEGWEKKGDKVETYFDDVARAINSYPGIEGSLPEVLEAGKTYDYSLDMSLSNVKNTWFRVIALITNAATGEIMNADEMVVYKDNGAGVEGVVSDSNIEIKAGNGEILVTGAQNVAVYTLDGRRVNNANLPAGVYFVNADGKSAKVLVK